MTGKGTSSAIVPKEEQAGVDMIPHGGNPVEGRDLGAAENMIDTVRAGKAQVARNDQHKGHGKGQLRQRPPKDQPKDCAVRPRHQQQSQDQQRRVKNESAAQRKQERYRLRRPPRAAPEPSQRAPEMDNKKWLAAFLEGQGIKGGKRTRMVAGILMRLESMNQPAPESESSVPTVAVGLLRAEKPKDVSQWRCKVPTCSESYHPLEQCQLFLQMSAQERGELVALSDLCRGCLTQGHGIKAQTCLFRNELKSLCAWPKCKEAHHQLLHVDGEQSRCPHQYLGGDAAAAKQRYAQAAAAVAHDAHQPPSQLMVQRIATKAKKSCLTLWDTGSQVSLTTHEAARGMGLEPIPGPPLNLRGVGDSQKTKRIVRNLTIK